MQTSYRGVEINVEVAEALPTGKGWRVTAIDADGTPEDPVSAATLQALTPVTPPEPPGGGKAPLASWQEEQTLAVVVPAWEGGLRGEFVQLERAWATTLATLEAEGAATAWFAPLGTCDTDFPTDRAAYVAINAIARYLESTESGLRTVHLVAATEEERTLWAAAATEVLVTMTGV